MKIRAMNFLNWQTKRLEQKLLQVFNSVEQKVELLTDLDPYTKEEELFLLIVAMGHKNRNFEFPPSAHQIWFVLKEAELVMDLQRKNFQPLFFFDEIEGPFLDYLWQLKVGCLTQKIWQPTEKPLTLIQIVQQVLKDLKLPAEVTLGGEEVFQNFLWGLKQVEDWIWCRRDDKFLACWSTTLHGQAFEEGHLFFTFEQEAHFWQAKDSLARVMKALQKCQDQQRLEGLVHTDEVTGLFNQRKLNEDLERLTSERTPFAVLFIDIDHFKQVNDSFGHMLGGEVLILLAKELKKMVRESDFIYRYGGDEFVAILPRTAMELAGKVADRIINHLKGKTFNLKFEESVYPIQLSVSIGIAEYPVHAHSKKEILHLADLMLYKAKMDGRGKFCLLSDERSS